MRWDCRCSCSRVSWCSEAAMVELFHNLALGFGVAFSPINLLLCLIGALVGTLVGVVLGLIFATVLAKGSVLKAIAMIVFGLLLSMVGSDIETGASRMAFNVPELADGLGFATVAMGVFGFAEIIRNLDAGAEMDRHLVQQKITGLMPTKKDLIDSTPAIIRGTILGSILGILPGGGAVIASFAAYTFEKKIAKDPSRFGRGAIEGVAAPESANNAAAQTSFIPLLTLGIPPNAVMALMVGAMTIHGIVPGPQVMQKQP